MTSKNNNSTHIAFMLLNKPIKLTLDMSIKIIKIKSNAALSINVVDHESTFRKMDTIKRITKKILLRGSSRCVIVLYGVKRPNVKLFMFGPLYFFK